MPQRKLLCIGRHCTLVDCEVSWDIDLGGALVVDWARLSSRGGRAAHGIHIFFAWSACLPGRQCH
eukprot:11878864-Karenia_brevis.AAC.1